MLQKVNISPKAKPKPPKAKTISIACPPIRSVVDHWHFPNTYGLQPNAFPHCVPRRDTRKKNVLSKQTHLTPMVQKEKPDRCSIAFTIGTASSHPIGSTQAVAGTISRMLVEDVKESLESADRGVTRWMARYGPLFLRLSLGIVFLWFGALKFFPELSPAQGLAGRTIGILTGGLGTPGVALPVLAAWECLIGIGLLAGRGLRTVLFLLYLQMLGTLTPIVLFPHEVFVHIPYAPTLEGQYIIKNLVLISAGIVIGATVRGGKMVADPPRKRKK